MLEASIHDHVVGSATSTLWRLMDPCQPRCMATATANLEINIPSTSSLARERAGAFLPMRSFLISSLWSVLATMLSSIPLGRTRLVYDPKSLPYPNCS
jgi:hypothetical protein